MGGNSLVVKHVLTILKPFFKKIIGDNSDLHVLLSILLNNTIKAFAVVLFGFFFWIFPSFFVLVNGGIVGFITRIFLDRGGTFLLLTAALLPHGIFEGAAFFIALAYSFWLSTRFMRKLTHAEPFRPYFYAALRAYAKIILPLLIIAAVIETFVTPLIMGWVQ